MLTDLEFTSSKVHCSHIFQASWDDEKFTELIDARPRDSQNITKDSPENMLLLHAHVELLYDHGKLLFEYDDISQNFICRILDKRIADLYIFREPQEVTFGEYDGKPLHFPNASRPLKRLIRFRAIVNRLHAIQKEYIGSHEYQHLMDSDDWSPGTTTVFDKIVDWRSKIPADSHLYLNSTS